MAIKASCPFCKKSFSAPEEYRGRRIDCPSCQKRFVLQTEAEVQAVALEQAAQDRKRADDRERLALLEKLESRPARRTRRPYFEEYQTGSNAVRHFNPRAPSRYLRFRSFSDVLVLGAYVELLLCALGMGLLIYLRIEGVIQSASSLFVLLTAWLVVALGLYLLFKYLGELAFLLSELGDQQNDLVQLLLDLRENTDTEPPHAESQAP